MPPCCFRRSVAGAIGALGAPAGRVEIAAAGSWLSAGRQVYAEHGHQIGFNAHRFEAWPSPFVTRAGVAHLARPWGEQRFQEFYDRLEERYPIVDNFGLAGAGLKYAFAADGAADAGDAAPRLAPLSDLR